MDGEDAGNGAALQRPDRVQCERKVAGTRNDFIAQIGWVSILRGMFTTVGHKAVLC